MENSQKQKAFALFAHLSNGKINNIAAVELNNENIDLIGGIKETHTRVGTIHAKDLYVKISKGFAGKDEPNGKSYGVHEKTKWIPYDDAELKRFAVIVRVNSKALDIARDAKGNPIIDPNTRQGMMINKTKISYMEVISGDRRVDIDEKLKSGYRLPMSIFTTDEKPVLTFYPGGDTKVYVRPNNDVAKTEKPAAPATNATIAEEKHEMAMIEDDLPF